MSSIFRLEWRTNPINPKIYDAINDAVLHSSDYSQLDEADARKFLEGLRAHAPVPFDAAISIRHIAIKQKIIKNYGRMNAKIAKIAREFKSGADIIFLSKKYDFPPLNLLRGIFLELKGYSAKDIYTVFAAKVAPEKILNGRDLREFLIADDADAENTFSQQEISARAYETEMAFVAYVQSLGIKIRTQEELVQSQTIEFGRAIITPDILFVDTVYINGVRVHWIDYKDYAGTKTPFLYKSSLAQVAKYNEKWGPGALCFSYSFVANLEFPGAMLLDISEIKIDLASRSFT